MDKIKKIAVTFYWWYNNSIYKNIEAGFDHWSRTTEGIKLLKELDTPVKTEDPVCTRDPNTSTRIL